MKLYGLKTCDSCRKALRTLKASGHEVIFVDVRGSDFGRADVERIVAAAGWETALNRRSATWRSLDDSERTAANDADAVELITAHPSLLKRPVIEAGDRILVGFGPAQQAQIAGLDS